MICLAGFPQSVFDEISKRSAKYFTGEPAHPPIMKRMTEPFVYRDGMADYYLGQLARRIGEQNPTEDIGVGVICPDYGESTSDFLSAFFPFAIVATVAPAYVDTVPKHLRRKAVTDYVDSLSDKAKDIRDRIAVVRDILSGNNFSHLTLPLRNFRSASVRTSVEHLFEVLGAEDDVRRKLETVEATLKRQHPRRYTQDQKRTAYFEDDRKLRFKSPGKDRHAMARKLADGHSNSCLIGARARLGGPIGHAFHYDCEYERRDVDRNYPNCHGADTEPFHRTHANIAPNDFIR